ncbi:hypothetical protein CR513_04819, partial [Mucuna pruriens]
MDKNQEQEENDKMSSKGIVQISAECKECRNPCNIHDYKKTKYSLSLSLFGPQVIVVRASKDLKKLPMEEFLGTLKVHEIKLNEDEGQRKGPNGSPDPFLAKMKPAPKANFTKSTPGTRGHATNT